MPDQRNPIATTTAPRTEMHMPDLHRLTIAELEPGKPGVYRLELDGRDIAKGVSAATLALAGGKPTDVEDARDE